MLVNVILAVRRIRFKFVSFLTICGCFFQDFGGLLLHHLVTMTPVCSKLDLRKQKITAAAGKSDAAAPKKRLKDASNDVSAERLSGPS